MKKKLHPWLEGCRYGIGGLFALGLISCGGGGGSGNNGGSSTYSISASVQKLTSRGLVLLVNSAQVSVNSGATSVSLASGLNTGATYTVTVQTQPTGETCSVSNGSGTIAASNVTNIVVACGFHACRPVIPADAGPAFHDM